MPQGNGEAGWRPWVVWSTAASVTVLAALALAGWAVDLDLLTTLVPGRATMKPNAALALVLAGGALAGLGWTMPRSWWAGAGGAAVFVIALASLVATRAVGGRVARVFSGAILVIGALGLLGHFFQVVILYTWYPFGSVALPTATAFVLLGF